MVPRNVAWGFAKIRGAISGAPIIRMIAYWGLYRVPPIWGKLRYIPCTDTEGPQRSRWKGKLKDADQGPLPPNTIVSINEGTLI